MKKERKRIDRENEQNEKQLRETKKKIRKGSN